jgi:hypothetical protein
MSDVGPGVVPMSEVFDGPVCGWQADVSAKRASPGSTSLPDRTRAKEDLNVVRIRHLPKALV